MPEREETREEINDAMWAALDAQMLRAIRQQGATERVIQSAWTAIKHWNGVVHNGYSILPRGKFSQLMPVLEEALNAWEEEHR